MGSMNVNASAMDVVGIQSELIRRLPRSFFVGSLYVGKGSDPRPVAHLPISDLGRGDRTVSVATAPLAKINNIDDLIQRDFAVPENAKIGFIIRNDPATSTNAKELADEFAHEMKRVVGLEPVITTVRCGVVGKRRQPVSRFGQFIDAIASYKEEKAYVVCFEQCVDTVKRGLQQAPVYQGGYLTN